MRSIKNYSSPVHQGIYNALALAAHKAMTEGGATIDLIKMDVAKHKTGYYVGVGKLYAGSISGLDFHGVAYEIDRRKPEFIGSWMDKDVLYIDCVAHIFELDRALQTARENSELAIWDIAAREEIRL